ncbi:MAG TPA: ABC transporter permease [Gemmatimonadales bacterium]|nr:ABC transporter permease [Gemmatimonadales bacterium]
MSRRAIPASAAWTAALTYVFLHLPLAILVAFSFNRSRFSVQWKGFTLQWFERLAHRPDVLRALRLSIGIGVASTLLATLLGTLLALALARYTLRGRRVYEGLLYLPIVTPEIVAGISLLLLFSALGVGLGTATIVIAHTAFSLPFVTVVVLARMAGMDRALEEAAMSLGADELTTFRRVTLPQLLPGIAAAALLAFTLSFDDFVITFFVAGVGSTTLPLVVYSMVRKSVEPTINAISTIMLVVTTALVWLAERLSRGSARG